MNEKSYIDFSNFNVIYYVLIMNVYTKTLVLLLCPFVLFAQKKVVKKKAAPVTITPTATVSIQPPLKLWYANPAQYFEEALVLGNGLQGATVFGGISTDKIYLNDLSLWSGEPVNANMNPQAYKNLPAVRKALQENNYKKAGELIKKLQGKFSESYAPLGTLLMDINDDPYITDYYRELDIDKAIAKVQTFSNANTIEREYLVSNPDKIFTIHLTSKKAGALSFTLRFESLLKHNTITTNNSIQVNGVAPVKADPNYVQKSRNAIVFDTKRGTRFSANIEIQSSTGKISKTDSTISLADATEATVYVSMATSFNGFDKDPASKGVNNVAIASSQLNNAKQVGWTEIKKRHIKDYQSFFNRINSCYECDDINKQILQSSMCSILYYKGFSLLRTLHLVETADFIITFADKLEKEGKSKKGYYTTKIIDDNTCHVNSNIITINTEVLVNNNHENNHDKIQFVCSVLIMIVMSVQLQV